MQLEDAVATLVSITSTNSSKAQTLSSYPINIHRYDRPLHHKGLPNFPNFGTTRICNAVNADKIYSTFRNLDLEKIDDPKAAIILAEICCHRQHHNSTCLPLSDSTIPSSKISFADSLKIPIILNRQNTKIYSELETFGSFFIMKIARYSSELMLMASRC
jgi:hypothetical protein